MRCRAPLTPCLPLFLLACSVPPGDPAVLPPEPPQEGHPTLAARKGGRVRGKNAEQLAAILANPLAPVGAMNLRATYGTFDGDLPGAADRDSWLLEWQPTVPYVAPTGQFAAQFAVGAFRFVSGKIEDGSYSIRTPTANLGIRGTAFQVLVDASGMTRVDVFEGLVAIQPLGQGRGAEVGEGRSGTVRTADSDVEIGDASVPAQRYRLRDDIERAAAPGRDDAGGSISFGQR